MAAREGILGAELVKWSERGSGRERGRERQRDRDRESD